MPSPNILVRPAPAIVSAPVLAMLWSRRSCRKASSAHRWTGEAMDQRLLRDIANSRTSTLRFLRPTFIRADGLHRFSRRCDDLESAARRACAFIRIGMTSPRRHGARSRAPARAAADKSARLAPRRLPRRGACRDPSFGGLESLWSSGRRAVAGRRMSALRPAAHPSPLWSSRAYWETPSMAKERHQPVRRSRRRPGLAQFRRVQSSAADRRQIRQIPGARSRRRPFEHNNILPSGEEAAQPLYRGLDDRTYSFWYVSKSEMSVCVTT